MGIISLRCRVSAASGGASPAAGGRVLVTPCRCRAILFSSSLYHLLIGRATRIGPSRAAGKNFNLRGTGRNVQPGHSCFLCSQVPADDGLPYRELFFLHTKPLPVVPPDMRAGRRYAPLPCSLCVLALELGPCGLGISSSRPESSGCGWVLWSLGFGAYAASGGRAMPSSSQVVSVKW